MIFKNDELVLQTMHFDRKKVFGKDRYLLSAQYLDNSWVFLYFTQEIEVKFEHHFTGGKMY